MTENKVMSRILLAVSLLVVVSLARGGGWSRKADYILADSAGYPDGSLFQSGPDVDDPGDPGDASIIDTSQISLAPRRAIPSSRTENPGTERHPALLPIRAPPIA